MKRITWPSLAGSNSHAALMAHFMLALLVYTAGARASIRPQVGGTLRVEMSVRVDNIDPRQWPSAPVQITAAERLTSLVFDRLVRLDEHGTPQPALAISWQHDAESKRWQFRLREGVKFSDGTLLTPAIAAMALQQLLGASFDVSASSDSVLIQADHSLPGIPMQLATGRYFIFHDGENGSLTGTGPFVFTIIESTGRPAQAVFVANETCWAGRPFVDKVSVSMNVESEQEANAIAFGQADVVDLPASQVRRTAQRGVRTVSSDPVDLFALVVSAPPSTGHTVRLGQAISLAIDRASIADVILQKQGVAAGGLLPNWISGFAHLFPPTFDLPRAKDLMVASGRQLSRPAPLMLVYDSSDAEARAVADRVAVNLKEAGILVQVSGQSADGKTKPAAADLRLVRHRIAAPDPAAAISDLLQAFGEAPANIETLEEVYDAERAPIKAFRVIPLVHVSENYGLSPQVRDWMAPRWGGWDLADVWLGPPPAAGSGAP
jgi:peptide/nickel transport system substrate-binding protein